MFRQGKERQLKGNDKGQEGATSMARSSRRLTRLGSHLGKITIKHAR